MQRVGTPIGGTEPHHLKGKESQILLKRYLPHVIKHFYWNLNKETGTCSDLYPNEDVNGGCFWPGIEKRRMAHACQD